MSKDPFDKAVRAKHNEEARTKTQEVTDLAKLILGTDADPRDIERTALAFTTLPKSIISHARKAVQKAGEAAQPASTTPAASEVAAALLSHPGLVHDVVGQLWEMDQKQIGAGPWHEVDATAMVGLATYKQWQRDTAWAPVQGHKIRAARVRVNPAQTDQWLWSVSSSLTPGRSDHKGSAPTCDEAKTLADEALAKAGWLLLG